MRGEGGVASGGFFLRLLVGGYVGEGRVRSGIRGRFAQLARQSGQVSIGLYVRKRLIRLRANRGIFRLRLVCIRRKHERLSSPEALVRVYRQEADRQKLLVKRSQLTENRLLFIVSALKKLFGDENFVTLLRAEGLGDLPAYLAERIQLAEKV